MYVRYTSILLYCSQCVAVVHKNNSHNFRIPTSPNPFELSFSALRTPVCIYV